MITLAMTPEKYLTKIDRHLDEFASKSSTQEAPLRNKFEGIVEEIHNFYQKVFQRQAMQNSQQLEQITLQLKRLEAKQNEQIKQQIEQKEIASLAKKIKASEQSQTSLAKKIVWQIDDRNYQLQNLFAEIRNILEKSLPQIKAELDLPGKQKPTMAHHLSWQIDDKNYETQNLIRKSISEVLVELNRDKQTDNLIEPQFINQDRVEKGDKLNLGAGLDIRPDYINIDFRELPGIDIVADVAELPVENGKYRKILAAHILEHFDQAQARDLLIHWYSKLGPGGTLTIIVPNIAKMILLFGEEKITWENLIAVILGGQDYEGNKHYAAYSPETLQELIQQSLDNPTIEVITTDRMNAGCAELEIKITKSA